MLKMNTGSRIISVILPHLDTGRNWKWRLLVNPNVTTEKNGDPKQLEQLLDNGNDTYSALHQSKLITMMF